MTDHRPSLVSASHFGYRYPHDSAWALSDLSLDLGEQAWLLLTGPSGSGKSTLARALNGCVPHFFGGQMAGALTVCGMDPAEVPMSDTFQTVGCLFQDTAAQLFEPTVERELVFGLASLGLTAHEIAQRVERTAASMGIVDLLPRAPQFLSGGEQQLILLAAFLALAPHLLVLDEPTTMLDARSRARLSSALQNAYAGETGLVVIDHHVDLYARAATRFALMEAGKITTEGSAAHVAAALAQSVPGGELWPAALWWKRSILPVLQRHGDDRGGGSVLPLTVAEAQERMDRLSGTVLEDIRPLSRSDSADRGMAGLAPAVEWNNVAFAYPTAPDRGRASADLPARRRGNALQDVTAALQPGEIVALLGPNGAGKSTLLRTLNGLARPQKGEVVVCGRPVRNRPVAELARVVAYAPQTPERLFFCSTVAEEIAAGPAALGVTDTWVHYRGELVETFGLGALLDRSPYSLSAGQQRRVALAAALAARPRVVALDEPTAGLDAEARRTLTSTLSELAASGTALVIATHDTEFAADVASRWLVLVEGRLAADDCPARIMADDALLREGALERSAAFRLDRWLSERLVEAHRTCNPMKWVSHRTQMSCTAADERSLIRVQP